MPEDNQNQPNQTTGPVTLDKRADITPGYIQALL